MSDISPFDPFLAKGIGAKIVEAELDSQKKICSLHNSLSSQDPLGDKEQYPFQQKQNVGWGGMAMHL